MRIIDLSLDNDRATEQVARLLVEGFAPHAAITRLDLLSFVMYTNDGLMWREQKDSGNPLRGYCNEDTAIGGKFFAYQTPFYLGLHRDRGLPCPYGFEDSVGE